MVKKTILLFIVFLFSLHIACSEKETEKKAVTAAPATVDNTQTQKQPIPPPKPNDSTEQPKIKKEKAAVIETNFGKIVFRFYFNDAPNTCENFITLTEKGFYDNLTFHRVVRRFVIQGGCPVGNGTGDPGYNIKAEFNSKKHLKGSVAMARSDHRDSAGCQFYICLAPQPKLDNKYTVFGQVIEGIDVVDKIGSVETAPNEMPIKPVIMNKVYIEEREIPE
ncbi:MAG: peptidylprolyl isomerase [Planctomycetota bacterium]